MEETTYQKVDETTFKEITTPAPTEKIISLDDLLLDEQNLSNALDKVRAKIIAVRAIGVKDSSEIEA